MLFRSKAGILACLQTGATLIPQLTFDPEGAMRAVQEHRITVLPGPPTIYQVLLDHPKRDDYDLTSDDSSDDSGFDSSSDDI